VRKYCRGAVSLWRYADDWVCAFECENDAQRFFRAVEQRLKKFKLELSPEKTQTIQFNRIDGGKLSFDFLGFEFRWGRDRNNKPHLKRRTSPKKFRKSIRAFTDWCRTHRNMHIGLMFKSLCLKLRGYYNYYGIVGNSLAISRFHHIVKAILHKWLNRRSDRKSYTWAGFHELLRHFKLPLPLVQPKRR